MENRPASGKKLRKPHFQRRILPGAEPGTIVTDPSSPRPVVRLFSYGPEAVEEREIASVAQLKEFTGKRPVTWIDVEGLGDDATLRHIGEIFRLHPLALEDVVHVHQRAKVEQYGNHLFIVARMLSIADEVETEQISLFLGRDFVLTFQEGKPGDCLDPVRERIRKGSGRIRSAGSDYLAYAVLDAVLDRYFPVLETIGDRLEKLEGEILSGPNATPIRRLHRLKRDLLTLRRAVWPFREALGTLSREASPMIGEETRLHLRDTYDHAVQVLDLVETYRELCADLRDVHLTAISNRMSHVMKVLTIIAVLFMPLSFIAGVYGMNFKTEASRWNMPELGWAWGYPYALGLMAVVAACLLFSFWRKGWLSSSAEDEGRDRGPE